MKKLKKLIFLFLFFPLITTGPLQAQEKKITIRCSNIKLEQAIAEIETKSGYHFLYNITFIDPERKVSLNKRNATLSDVLDELLQGSDIQYKIDDNKQVVLYLGNTGSDTVTGIASSTSGSASNKASGPVQNSQSAQSQVILVAGTVMDADDNTPVAYAAVQVKGSNIFALTNEKGIYTIQVNSPNDVLVFSLIGMKTKEEPLAGRSIINVLMQQEVNVLHDVIVTGYRTIAKEHATGSYTVLSSEMFENTPVVNISSALRGMVPGMAGVSTNSEGDETRFVIRGRGTLEGQIDRDPLIVVDGFPIQGVSSIPTNRVTNNPFSTINPNDIESITVLKDAAATAIYGARAANGVIVLTTKKGRAGEKVFVSVNAFTSVSSKFDIEHFYNLASPETMFWHAENLLKWDPTYNITNPYANPASPFITDSRYEHDMLLFETFRQGNITEQEYNSRKAEMIALGNRGIWKDDLNKYYYRNQVYQQYNVAVRGGSATHNYSFSAAFDKNDSYIRSSSSQRTMLNFINSVKFGPKVTLKVGVNGSIEISKGTAGSANTSISTTAANSIFADPTFQLTPWTRFVDDEGNYLPHEVQAYTVYSPILSDRYGDRLPVSWYYNPIENIKYTPNTSTRFNVRVNAGLDYDITNSLKVKLAGQYERNQYLFNQTFDPESFLIRNYVNKYSTLNADTGKYVTYFPDGGMLYEAGDRYEGYMLRFQTDYNKRFGEHVVTLLAGSEVSAATTNKIPELYRYGYNKFTNAVLTSVDYFSMNRNIFGVNERMPYAPPGTLNTSEDRFFSAYLDAQYTFKDRYNLTASARTDAYNYQAINVRDKFSPFYSVGAAWLMSRENFIKEVTWISSLKLRVTYGLAGLAAGKSTNSAITTVSVSPGSIAYTNNEPYNAISTRGNSTLTWEKSRTTDVGIDFNLWRDKLHGGLSYYDRYSYDVLASASVAMISQGVATATFNNAAISNRGVEASLGTNLKIAGDLMWNMMLTFSYNKNKLVKYNVLASAIRPTYYPGYPLSSRWAYNIHRYTDEGYQVLLGKDGTEEVADSRTTTHLYDTLNGAAGETLEDYNWIYWAGQDTPTTYLGFTNTFTYKGFSLTFKMTGKFGHVVQEPGASSSILDGYKLENAKKILDEGYANQKTYTVMPLFNADNYNVFAANGTYNSYLNSLHVNSIAYLFKGDHIRLNEVYLGYELPNRLLAKSKLVSGVKIYTQAKNLGVIWALNDRHKDPESRMGTFKPMTTFTFGLNFNFNFN